MSPTTPAVILEVKLGATRSIFLEVAQSDTTDDIKRRVGRDCDIAPWKGIRLIWGDDPDVRGTVRDLGLRTGSVLHAVSMPNMKCIMRMAWRSSKRRRLLDEFLAIQADSDAPDTEDSNEPPGVRMHSGWGSGSSELH